MKRKIVLALSLLGLVAVLLVLASCGDHEHNFGATWRQDDNSHWHACLVEGCIEVSDKGTHNFVKDGAQKEATCETDGLKKLECKTCGMKKEEVVPALGHNMSERVISPSCAGDGYTEITCTRKGCDYSEKKDVVPGGHDFVEVPVAPTCTEGGKTMLTCSKCDIVDEKDVVDPLGHDLIETVVDPTCIAEGYTTVICSRCDFTDQINPTEKVDHNYVDDVEEPTCTEGGYTAKICSVCGDAQDKSNFTDPLGHDVIKGTVVEPTCEDKGYTPVTCSRCDYTDKVDFVDPMGHNEIKGEPIAARCVVEGYTPVTCSRCDYTDRVDIVPAIGHKYYTEEDAQAGVHFRIFDEDLPTCDTDGLKYYICQNCRQMPIEEGKTPVAIPMLGHDMQYSETVSPTCTLDGFDILICSRCDKEDTTKNGDATGHKYYKEADAEEAKHFIVTLEPTCTEDGERSYYCQNEGCGELATDDAEGKSTIAKLGHKLYVAVEPWCGNDSSFEYKCENVCRGIACDHTDVKKGDEEKRHTYNLENKIIAETCVDYATYECSECHDSFVAYEGDEHGQPTGEHKYDNPIEEVPPTCTAKGYTIYACVAGNCGTTENRDYTDIIAHTLGEASELGTVTCLICNKSYVDVTAEAVGGSDKLCICGQDPCVCGGTTAEWEGFTKPKDPMKITANQEFTITEVVWTDGPHQLAIGYGLIILNSDENASYTVVIYTAEGTELNTFEKEGSSVMIDLYQYVNVGKVVITSTADAEVSFFKVI